MQRCWYKRCPEMTILNQFVKVSIANQKEATISCDLPQIMTNKVMKAQAKTLSLKTNYRLVCVSIRCSEQFQIKIKFKDKKGIRFLNVLFTPYMSPCCQIILFSPITIKKFRRTSSEFFWQFIVLFPKLKT